MSKHSRTTTDILKDVQATLKTSEDGLEQLVNGPPPRKLSGLRNLVVFGRAVTNVLQGLRSTEPEFNAWYKKYVDEMESDPLLKFFYKLRSVILKKGILKTARRIFIKKLTIPDDLPRLGEPRLPFRRKSFFVDQFGGTGWEVELPDGSKLKYYVELPSDIGSVSMHFPEPPNHHLGKAISGYSVENLSALYVAYLRKMVREAKTKFGRNQ